MNSQHLEWHFEKLDKYGPWSIIFMIFGIISPLLFSSQFMDNLIFYVHKRRKLNKMGCCALKSLDYLKHSWSCVICLVYCVWLAGRKGSRVERGDREAAGEGWTARREGNVDEAQTVLQEVERVRTKKKDAEVVIYLQAVTFNWFKMWCYPFELFTI